MFEAGAQVCETIDLALLICGGESALIHIKTRQPKLKWWLDMTYNMHAQMLARHLSVNREHSVYHKAQQ